MQIMTLQMSRSRMLIAIMAVLGAIFVVRLFYLQVVMHDFYEKAAIAEHQAKFTIPSSRGLIYAHDGKDNFVPLVLNEPAFTVYADPRYVKDPNRVEDVLRRVAGGDVVNDFGKGLRDTSRQYAVLARLVSKKQADLIKAEHLAGVGLQEADRRVYPEGKLGSQMLGFVNGEGKGQYGVEQALNDDLSGTPGQLKAVTDVRGIPLTVGQDTIETPAQDGKNLVLTVDRNIQAYTETALKKGLENARASIGSVLIMDPSNGHVLAAANTPTFNPNDFSRVTDYRAFENRALTSAYEPGSVIKTFTMAAGLDAGIIQPDTTYNNTGSVQIEDAVIRNVLTAPTGAITMTQVLEYSFNTGAVQVLKWMGGGEITPSGKQKFYDYFTDRFMLGKPTGITIAGEGGGQIIAPNDPQGGNVRYANMSFGQGMSSTMLQVSAAFSAMINGGTYYQPQIVSGYLKDGKFTPKPAVIKKSGAISSAASAKLRTMTETARRKGPAGLGDKPGYRLGGKTGTAQVYDPKTGDYSATETIGTYLGFGGRDTPRYVIMIRVDDSRIGGYSGSAAAAPIFTDISNWMIDYLQIQPKG